MNHKNVITWIITILLMDQNQISILNLWFHRISFCTNKETILQILHPDKCHRYRNTFLCIFIYHSLSLISTLSKSKDRKLNYISIFISNGFTYQTISAFILYEISFQNKLIELIQNRLRMFYSDFCRNFSKSKSLSICILFEE